MLLDALIDRHQFRADDRAAADVGADAHPDQVECADRVVDLLQRRGRVLHGDGGQAEEGIGVLALRHRLGLVEHARTFALLLRRPGREPERLVADHELVDAQGLQRAEHELGVDALGAERERHVGGELVDEAVAVAAAQRCVVRGRQYSKNARGYQWA